MNNRISIATIDSPEFVNLQPMDINPLMSKCDVKVLYIGQNRNRSSITKQVATEMSKTLRGCPIVGYYIEKKEDFGDHGDQVIIDGEGIKFNKLTKPYGFVAPDAKVWFQFFEDQDEFGNTCVREYLMTEGYLWTGQFEECQRVLENSNPQSMELDEKTLKGYWSTDNNKGVDFFIINDAVFSKLCILGDDVEPCFEGANVSAPNLSSQFSKDDEFAKSLFTMMSELKFALNNSEGGKPMHNEIQNELDNNVESTSFENQDNVEAPATQFEDGGEGSETTPTDTTEGAPEGGEAPEQGDTTPEEGAEGAEGTEDSSDPAEVPATPLESPTVVVDGVELNDTDKEILKTLDKDYAPEGETNPEALVKDGATNVPTQILQNAKAKDEEEKKNEDEKEKSDSEKSEDNTEDVEEKKKKFSLEQELAELQTKFAALQAENAELLAFKQGVEEKEKDELIASFYMLSDEDKKDVIENKANYSLKEIKAELSMICVDKKVNFNLENASSVEEAPVTFNLNSHQADTLPAWLKAVEDTRNRNK